MAQPYQDLIETIVAATLKGKIQSKQQVYRLLEDGLEPGSGELFERALATALAEVEANLAADDEFKQAKAQRRQRALNTIESEWQRWQSTHQAASQLSQITDDLRQSAPEERLGRLLAALDPNRDRPSIATSSPNWPRLSRQQISTLTP